MVAAPLARGAATLLELADMGPETKLSEQEEEDLIKQLSVHANVDKELQQILDSSMTDGTDETSHILPGHARGGCSDKAERCSLPQSHVYYVWMSD